MPIVDLRKCGEDLGPAMEEFPNGSCGEVAPLLAAYLEDLGFGQFHYVSAWDQSHTQSHGWLRQGELVVDITADQFGQPPVLVETDSAWHAAWKVESEWPGSYRLEDDYTKDRCELLLAKITECISAG